MDLIKCYRCKTEFKPTFDQLNFISSSRGKGMKLIMLECGNCRWPFPFNLISIETPKKEAQSILIRTPIAGSHGFISFVEDEDGDFYGCGETGAIWRKEKNLLRDIEIIVKKYSHRKLCYSKTVFGWIANPNEPENMDELIDTEVIEELNKFERD